MKVIFGIEIKKPALQPVFVVFVSGGVPCMKIALFFGHNQAL
jgi:hypothetical protein